MTKYTLIICAVCVSCFGLWALIHGMRQADHSAGFSECIAAQKGSDNLALIDSAQKMVAAYETTQKGLEELAGIDDKTMAGPAITVALDRLHLTRKPPRNSPASTSAP